MSANGDTLDMGGVKSPVSGAQPQKSSSTFVWRKRKEVVFIYVCRIIAFSAIALLGVLLWHIGSQGWEWLSTEFLSNYPSRFPHKAGIKAPIYGTIWLISMTAMISIPLGVLAAIYLEEFAPKNKLSHLIEINIANLAGVPSIVFGLLGLTVFVRWFSLGQSLWSGALTLSLLVLPVIIISTRHAIRGIPRSIREAAFALGATRWQVAFGQVLPASIPGIMTGVILALSRAIGETAPLIIVGALSYVAFVPEGPSDMFTTLPIQIFNWASRPKIEFHGLSAAAIVVLLVVLLSMNLVAVFIRQRSQKGRM